MNTKTVIFDLTGDLKGRILLLLFMKGYDQTNILKFTGKKGQKHYGVVIN